MHPSPFNWLEAASYHAQAHVVSMEAMLRQKLLIILKYSTSSLAAVVRTQQGERNRKPEKKKRMG